MLAKARKKNLDRYCFEIISLANVDEEGNGSLVQFIHKEPNPNKCHLEQFKTSQNKK